MCPTPLRPPSVSDVGERGPHSEEGRAWPGTFDAPETVERVWIDFVAALPDPAQRTALRRAVAFARARHGEQRRRGSDTPYWVHLVRVAMELARWGETSPVLLQAALLHDTVEDTATGIGEIRVGFGPEVADLVDWLTAPDDQAELRGYYARLRAQAPFAAQVLKLADRVDNLRSIQALVMRTGDRYTGWAATYLRRTVWQVLPLAAAAPSVARVALVTAMADLAPLVGDDGFTEP
ncbi:HD domain-containing protein [Miltoncostaea oceani]|jgi:guanosine-3',5'-bis(diphosphate) 3'-pyrophosphohydrolase|uniref:HD domain-containing protein n=1 Tax=Miltoncostaea oceani TaxID=2843216 RepID=UPI001C3C2B1C|nr:HD domain-containing protein [Miltoncostaea oceani]